LKFDPEVTPICEYINSNPFPEETREYAFTEAIRFYKNIKYFEAHEIFEFQWKKEKGNSKIFLQALIQICVSMNKVFVNVNIRGAISQASLALEKLNLIKKSNELFSTNITIIDSLIENLERLIKILNSERGTNDYLPPELEKDSLFSIMKNL
jgi:predicted metal-dependent hydrolase